MDKAAILEKSNSASNELDADIIFLNAEMYPPLDFDFTNMVEQRTRRPKVILILVTPGGLPDTAYRIGRRLQHSYNHVSIVVSGWCKSAGSILCASGHELLFGAHGEIGPIDVQIRREDEIGERDSGLSVESAFESLQQASFKIFENCMLDIKDHSYGSITFKTAAEIASNMAVGMVAPIFSQLDPIKIGETYRSVRIAEEYARRLAIGSKNIQNQGINMLLRGYPAHGFAIDKNEASALFKNVSTLDGSIHEVVSLLGNHAIEPISAGTGNARIMEYLNEKTDQQPKAGNTTTAKKRATRTKTKSRRK